MAVWEALDSILEMGMGIAGFSAVVIAFGRREWTSKTMLLLPSVLDIAFVTVVLAFIPMILLTTTLSQPVVWQIASAATAAYIAVVIPYRTVRIRQLFFNPINRGRRLSLAVNTLILGLSLANVFWLHTGWPHLAALVLMLALSFGVFSFLVTELWINPAFEPTGGNGRECDQANWLRR